MPGHTSDAARSEGSNSVQSLVRTTHEGGRASIQSPYCFSRRSALRKRSMTFSMFSIDLSASLVVALLSACTVDISIFSCEKRLSHSSIPDSIHSNSESSGNPVAIESGIYVKVSVVRNVWYPVPFVLGRQPLGQVRKNFGSALLVLLSKASVLRLCEISNLLRPSRMVLFASSKSEWHN